MYDKNIKKTILFQNKFKKISSGILFKFFE